MKKLQLLAVTLFLMISAQVKATDKPNAQFDLINPDVRKCLIEATQSEGWKLLSAYKNSEEKLVIIFEKDKQTKVYVSK